MIDPAKLTAFDVETWGTEDLYALQPFRVRTGDAWLTSAAIAYDLGDGIASESVRRPTPEELANWLDTVAGTYVVGWNVPFDIAWLLAIDETRPRLGIRDKVFAVHWLDGMLLYHHAINVPRYMEGGQASLGLKDAVAQFFPHLAGYQEGVSFDPQTEDEWAKLLTYNERDCIHTLRITQLLLQTLPRQVVRNALIEARCLPLVADTKVQGLRLNAEKAQALGDDLKNMRDAALTQLAFKAGMLEWEKIIASPKQLVELLYRDWGLTPPHFTDKGQPSTDKEALAVLGADDPRAGMIYTYRECNTRRTKFCEGALNSLDYNGDGHTRPDFRVFGTYTGRGTYSSKQGKGKAERPTGIAIHQWVNDPQYRALIEVDEDSELIEADFAGQEYRWMAVESEDPVMMEMCGEGHDPHAFMASCIVPGWDYGWIREHKDSDPEAKQIRKLGKVGNLSCQYRTGPPTLRKVAAIQHNVALTLEQAQAIVRIYKRIYRGVQRYWKRQIQFARTHAYVDTLAGRRVHLGEYKGWDEKNVWGYESTAINFPIQGIGADQKYLALLVARDYLPTVGGRFLMELHDGMFFRVPKGQGERAARDLKQMFSNLPYRRAWKLDRELPVTFPVDVKLGPNWGALKELKDT